MSRRPLCWKLQVHCGALFVKSYFSEDFWLLHFNFALHFCFFLAQVFSIFASASLRNVFSFKTCGSLHFEFFLGSHFLFLQLHFCARPFPWVVCSRIVNYKLIAVCRLIAPGSVAWLQLFSLLYAAILWVWNTRVPSQINPFLRSSGHRTLIYRLAVEKLFLMPDSDRGSGLLWPRRVLAKADHWFPHSHHFGAHLSFLQT